MVLLREGRILCRSANEAPVFQVPFFVATHYGVPPPLAPLAVAAAEAGSSLAGHEVALTAGLPLRIVPHAEFDESSIPLAHGQQHTLVSDGFDRTRDISTESAQAGARTTTPPSST